MSENSSEVSPPSSLSKPLQVVKPRVLAQLEHLDLTSRITFSEDDFVSGGGYGDVFKGKCTQADGKDVFVAIKRLRFYMREDIKSIFEKEIYVWSKLQHNNILPLLGYAFPNSHGYPLFISEWMENGSAWTYVMQNPNCNLLHLVTGIAQGLAYLHSKGIVHSDIKSDNILVSGSGNPLICDFGCSRMLFASQSIAKISSNFKGTPRYQAYELLTEDGQFKGYTKEADVWAFGMTVYELLARQRPYAHLTDLQVSLAISRRELPPPPPTFNANIWKDSGVRLVLWDVCQHCWIHDPSVRIDMASVLMDLQSPRGRRGPTVFDSQSSAEMGWIGSSGDTAGQLTFVDLMAVDTLRTDRRHTWISSVFRFEMLVLLVIVVYIIIVI